MPLPTLLRPGSIVSHINKPNKESIIAIDYIMEYIGDRCAIKGKKPKIPPNELGDKVIILRSGTGSGKSTTIAPELYLRFHDKVGRNIAITQPRVLTAIDIPRDIVGIPTFSTLKLEKNIGFQTGDFSRLPSESGIIFMTIGILMNQLVTMEADQFMNKYSFIIIDEVHDRDVNNDATQFLLKKFLYENWKNPACPMVILMSATFDPSIFMDYYECSKDQFIDVKGETFPIEEFYPKYDVSNYLTYAYEKAIELHLSNPADFPSFSDDKPSDGYKPSDIIIFVKGKKDGKELLEKFNTFNTNQYMTKSNLYVSPILLTGETFHKGGTEYINTFSGIYYIKVPVETTRKSEIADKSHPQLMQEPSNSIIVAENTQNGEPAIIEGGAPKSTKMSKKHEKVGKTILITPLRKIFIATNIAETGVTIDTLKYCIDTGYVTSSEFNPDVGCKILLGKNVTKGMAIQRRGRVGRKSPGNWFPCYTQDVFESLPIEQFSQILTSDITQILLNIFCRETGAQIVDIATVEEHDIKCGNVFRMYKISTPSWFKLDFDKKLDISQLDFLESPSASSLQYSIEKLYGLGFLTSKYDITLFGYLASKFQKISIESIKMILSGYHYGANILDLITIASALFADRLTERDYVYRNPLKLKELEAIFYNKVIFADEFIDKIFLWNEFENETKKLINSKYTMSDLKLWCESNKINYYTLGKMIAIRDEIIENMLKIGLNPYYNGLNLRPGTYNLTDILKDNLEDGLNEITKIKKCIFEGFKFNLITSSHPGKYSLFYKQIPITLFSKLVKPYKENQSELPKKIIISQLNLIPTRMNPTVYTLANQGLTSVLDGIDIDWGFLSN
jgi:HrpA-like RNA helicase